MERSSGDFMGGVRNWMKATPLAGKCESVERFLSSLSGRPAMTDLPTRIRLHIARCGACRREHTSILKLDRLLEAPVTESPPPPRRDMTGALFTRAVMSQIRTANQAPNRVSQVRWIRWVALVLAAGSLTWGVAAMSTASSSRVEPDETYVVRYALPQLSSGSNSQIGASTLADMRGPQPLILQNSIAARPELCTLIPAHSVSAQEIWSF
ncbi:MAG: hypothetical protein ACKVX7_12255 [Planctomycetota bacterium]